MDASPANGQHDIARTVRAGDRDRYVAALFAPPETRPIVMALAAFNLEMARIPDLVSEPMLAEIRYQWWRDALQQVAAGGTPGHPLADALAPLVRDYPEAGPALTGMIDARNFDISGSAMPDLGALNAYLGKTAGAMLFLQGLPLCRDAAERSALSRAANSCGRAYGLVTLLRDLPLHLSRGRLVLPADLTERCGVDPESLLHGRRSEASDQLTGQMVEEARRALRRARDDLTALDPGLRSVCLILALCDSYVRLLARPDHDPLRQIAALSPLTRAWQLTRGSLTGRI